MEILKVKDKPLNGDDFTSQSVYDEAAVLRTLKKYLPAQAPLKDFIFQNNLQAFQHLNFFKALNDASEIFGYKGYLSLGEFRRMFKSGKIREDILDKVIADRKGGENIAAWKEKLTVRRFEKSFSPRIGQVRTYWKREYRIDMDSLVQPTLFRILCSYLDQGISIWNFPVWQKGFLQSVREMEKNSFSSFFKTKRARKWLLEGELSIEKLLKTLVGDPSLYEHYLFDQQFSHQGWSGIVSVIEDRPYTLMDRRTISLKELIIFELLLEIDVMDLQFGKGWEPLNSKIRTNPVLLFEPIEETELNEVLTLWQEAFEWTYYDQVLAALIGKTPEEKVIGHNSFQAFFCIDDRETSLRDYLEKTDPDCETFATPGFFNVEFFFQPEAGKAYTKLCPAPVTPGYLIKETGNKEKRKKELFLEKLTHSVFGGWIISQSLGYWSALKLAINIFRPSMGPATSSSFRHMDKVSRLTIENINPEHRENGLQIGFTIPEMAQRVEGMLRSTGLVGGFAPVVYIIGHGASSVNNPYYAAMDCGACSCRPGSVNARAFCYMANHNEVRKILRENGIVIPDNTQFIGGLHDTTRDDIVFYDEESLNSLNKDLHMQNHETFEKALNLNSKERARRFESVNTKLNPEKIHEKLRTRSVSLFEPRPELDHATNALMIIGRRDITRKIFLDRRAFMNSYNFKIDPDGNFLARILNAAAPVCGGINMAYYFSRVDNQKLGAGTKLPHNVMGLFGVANGIEGDLRPGLPSQMVESHDPLRQLFIVEHYPDIVLAAIQKNEATYEWFINDWINLCVLHPETRQLFLFRNGVFSEYFPVKQKIETISDLTPVIESSRANLPVYYIS